MEPLTIIMTGIMIFMVICMFFEKRVRTQYNGAVGLLGGFVFFLLLMGAILSIGLVISGDEDATYLINVPLSLVIAAIPVFLAWRKCPAGKKGVFPLLGAMCVVGAAAIFKFALKGFGWILKVLIHVDLFSGGSGGVNTYANFYKRQGSSEEYQLWTVNGNYAVLKGPGGDTVSVRPHGNDGLVCDDSNNLYQPI